MIEFINKLFGRHTSGATAKERLRLVLMSDHLSLAPEMIESMKRDLVDVISRYVEVDRTRIDVHFEHQDKALAMLANIPITGVNRNGSKGNGSNGASHNATATVPESVSGSTPCHPELVEGRSEPQASATVPKPKQSGPRRKRKKSGGSQPNAAAPAT